MVRHNSGSSLPTGLVTSRQFGVLLLTVFVSIGTATPNGTADDQIPGAPQTRARVIRNAVLHPITGPPIEDAALLFDGGKIIQLGPDFQAPENSEIIDAEGQHLYPGLIEAHSHLGLTEISSTRATVDMTETGELNPNVRAQVSVNPDSELIPVTRANGVLLALSAPSGGLVSGRAAFLQLDGWTYEDMTVREDVALMIHWPRRSPPRTDESPPPRDAHETPELDAFHAQLKQLRELFDDARVYARARENRPDSQRFDGRLESMVPVINRDIPLLIAADRAEQIESAVAFGVEQECRVVILGGHDAEACSPLLVRYSVPVIIDAIHKDPRRDHEDTDASYSLPARLKAAGVQFCISGSGRSETWNTRNLPYQAATAVAFGLSYEDAVRSITLWPAEILGVADRVGSLEPDKDATFFLCTGDPLETESQVTAAWIQGRPVDLRSRHTELYEKYREKYEQLDQQQGE